MVSGWSPGFMAFTEENINMTAHMKSRKFTVFNIDNFFKNKIDENNSPLTV